MAMATIGEEEMQRSMEKEPKAAKLTVFYAGQEVVFNDFPVDKVEEIMSLASKGISYILRPELLCICPHSEPARESSFNYS
ncbi:TIFY 10A [Spatholobus suberectus]|nr:TIFY 10A [Spatholobus suberectus]